MIRNANCQRFSTNKRTFTEWVIGHRVIVIPYAASLNSSVSTNSNSRRINPTSQTRWFSTPEYFACTLHLSFSEHVLNLSPQSQPNTNETGFTSNFSGSAPKCLTTDHSSLYTLETSISLCHALTCARYGGALKEIGVTASSFILLFSVSFHLEWSNLLAQSSPPQNLRSSMSGCMNKVQELFWRRQRERHKGNFLPKQKKTNRNAHDNFVFSPNLTPLIELSREQKEMSSRCFVCCYAVMCLIL